MLAVLEKISARNSKIAIAILVSGCFLPLGESLHSAFWSAVSDGIHLPLFFILIVLVNIPLRPFLPGLWSRLAAIFAVALIGAVVIEIIQPYFGRSKSLVDVENGMIGTILGMGLIALSETRLKPQKKWWALLALATAGGTFYVFWPALNYWQLEKLQAERFPTLTGFGSELEQLAWEPYGGATVSYKYEIEFLFGGKSFSGAELVPPKRSWRPYRLLSIDFEPPTSDTSVWIRIDDNGKCEEINDRFERRIQLDAVRHNVEIPLEEIENQPTGRKLNLDSIKRVLLFASAKDAPARAPIRLAVRSMSLMP